MTIGFTSDIHFGHKMMARMRGFGEDTDAMDDWLIAAWNTSIQDSDEVFHLGDFSFSNPKRTKQIVQQLKGRIHLVPGNHDSRQALQVLAESKVTVLPVIYRRHFPGTEQKVVLSHYPLLTWPSAHYGALHFHGHSHGNLGDERTTRTDVGVDSYWGPSPVSWDTLLAVLSKRRYRAVDHHK